MHIDKEAEEVVREVEAALLSPYVKCYELAARLRSILPKPRFYAEGRWVGQSIGRVPCHHIPETLCPDDATAHALAADVAAASNWHLEVDE
ncbi:MAG: hypothetical protein WA125_04710 [Desulfosporosinus sp.]